MEDPSTNGKLYDMKCPQVGEKTSALKTDAASLHATEIGTAELISVPNNAGFHRTLHRRQIMMMTFGAGIGTGLWVGTGSALARAGPAGLAVAYTIMAWLVYLMYTSIGEMTAFDPQPGGFIRQTLTYTDPALAFAVGINFWFSWTMIIPAEVVAAISVLDFWSFSSRLPVAAWITIVLVIITIANLFPVRVYGEIEYFMSAVKCIAIVAMIFFMVVMASGGIEATGGPLVFHFWKRPGAFNNGMKGICQAFLQAGFSFGGGEHIAIIAGEATQPRKTVKACVMPIFWRMFTFFVVNIWLVGMCVPYDDPRLLNASGTLASPFVIAIERAGIMPLAHVLNAFILITVISCGITSIYIASRALTSLSDLEIVHPLFGKKDAAGRPYIALAVSTILGGGLCYLNCNDTGAVVYSWLSSLTGVIIATLVLISIGYLALIPFDAPPSATNFFSHYISVPLFFIDFLAYKLYYRTRWARPSEIDFTPGVYWDEEDRRERETEEVGGKVTEGASKRVFMRIIG